MDECSDESAKPIFFHYLVTHLQHQALQGLIVQAIAPNSRERDIWPGCKARFPRVCTSYILAVLVSKVRPENRNLHELLFLAACCSVLALLQTTDWGDEVLPNLVCRLNLIIQLPLCSSLVMAIDVARSQAMDRVG